MKQIISIFILLLCLNTSITIKAEQTNVYVLNINDEIGSKTWRYAQQACEQATLQNADILIVRLNTYGGTVEHADSIRTRLLNYPKPVIAFIDNNAASAGALIAIACDEIYMRQGASIGAATVVDGTGSQLPDKYQSYMRSIMRSTAESHGKIKSNGDTTYTWKRNPLIAEAMVDSRTTVPGLIDSTKVLTFTPEEAIKWNYCEGIASNINDILVAKNIKNYSIEEYKPSWVDILIGFFTNPAVQAILIMFIIGGIYFELQSPGMGFPSAAAIIAAILYFLPLYITGIAESWIIVVFLIGMILLILEIFVIPGSGIAGIIGGITMIFALFGALLDNFSLSLSEITASDLWYALAICSAGIILAIIAIFYLTSSKYGNKYITRHSELQATQKVEDGFIGVDMQPSECIGKTGLTINMLRPSGKIEIEGTLYDAVAITGYIEENTKVKIIKYENSQLYVAKLTD